MGTTQSTSSQVPTWATSHTDRFRSAIQLRPPNLFKNTFLFTLFIPVSIPSPPQHFPPDAIVFPDRCLRIPTGGGFVGKPSRWRPPKSPPLPRESLDAIRQGTLPPPSFPSFSVSTSNARSGSMGSRCGGCSITRAFTPRLSYRQRREIRSDDFPIRYTFRNRHRITPVYTAFKTTEGGSHPVPDVAYTLPYPPSLLGQELPGEDCCLVRCSCGYGPHNHLTRGCNTIHG